MTNVKLRIRNIQKSKFEMRGLPFMILRLLVVVQGLNTFRKFQNEER